MADADLDEREARFLAQRQARDAERAAAKAAAGDSEAAQREAFNAEVAQLEAKVKATLSDESVPHADRATTATEQYQALQRTVRTANESLRLTAYETKSADAALANALTAIEAHRAAAAPAVKKFSFGSRKNRDKKADGAATTAAPAATAGGVAPTPDAAPSAGPSAAEIANTIADLRDTTVFIGGPRNAAFIRRCTNATIFTVPVNGSVFLSDCRNCTVYTSCHQMRVKSCADVTVYTWCRSTPVVEASKGMRFGPYQAWTGALASAQTLLLGDAGSASYASLEALAVEVGGITDAAAAAVAYKDVADFDWIKQTHSPNWAALGDDASSWAVRDDVAAARVSSEGVAVFMPGGTSSSSAAA